MLYGDSVTQGSSGDWTWRYWLWRHLAANFVPFDLVGPHNDLHGWPDGQPNDQTYADPAFDRDHAALWAQMFTQPTDDLADLVPAYDPDVVVASIGVNDVTNGVDPAVVGELWRQKIVAARADHPGIRFVLVQAPQTWLSGVEAYNQVLLGLAQELDDPEGERVVATRLPSFDKGSDTWDPAHPTASGEQKIAAAVVDALAELGVVAGAGMSPVAFNGPTRAPDLVGRAEDGAVDLSWSAVPGVTDTWLERRDATIDERWIRYPMPWSAHDRHFLAELLPNGHEIQFRLRPAKGWAISPVVTSNVVTVVPGVPLEIAGVAVAAADHALEVSWDADALATSYEIVATPSGGGESVHATSTAAAVRMDGLIAGESYAVRVRGVRDGRVGPASTPISATPSGPTLVGPALAATARPDGTVSVSWAVPPGATRLVLEIRDGVGWRDLSVLDASVTRTTLSGLRNGARVELRMHADHQRIDGASGPSTTVAVPLLDASVVRRVRSPRRNLVITRGAPAAYADGYRLEMATGARCRRHQPAQGRFRVVAARSAPRVSVRTRAPAVWVRWVAVRRGVVGMRAPATCIRVR